MIRAILLDLDGTLLDRREAVRRCLRHLVPADAIEEAVTLERDLRGRELRRALDRRFPQFPITFGELRRRLRSAAVDGARPDHRRNTWLSHLTSRWPLGVVTDGDGPTQREKLLRMGIEGCFQTVVISKEAGAAKPASRIFQEALRRLGSLPASEVLFVGDDPVRDIAGAAATGMRTCLVGSGPAITLACPDIQVERTLDLTPALVDAL